MLCTLQEAYNVPSFDTAAKKRRGGCTVQAKASADPYDPYLPESGRGEVSAYIKEGFQTSQNRGQQDTDPKYSSRAGDYNFYGKEYNIALPTFKEGFESPSPVPASKQCSPHPQVYEFPVSDEAKKQHSAAMKTAMEQQSSQQQTVDTPKTRKADMNGVSGYVDDDLEQYLQTKDMKAAPFVTPPSIIKKGDMTSTQPYDPESSPFAKAMDVFKGQMTPVAARSDPDNFYRSSISPSYQQSPKRVSLSSIWDILIFAVAGLLIMFLCEQLFKMAMLIGMKRTVEILEPYLTTAAAASTK